MTDLRAIDEAARETALDVRRSFVVQAPAGSGKTELLTRRFLALLATVEDPESVLAITFTRKAATEMRDRVVRALRAAAGHSTEPAPHRRTLELAAAALEADRRLGWDLLGNPARLRIQTIDSLNFGLARRLPLLSGLGAGLGVQDDATELHRLAAERLLEHLPGDDRHADAVATLLEHLDNRVDRFVDLVVEMLARRDSWGTNLPAAGVDARSSAALRARLEAARSALIQDRLGSLAAGFGRARLAEAAAIAADAGAVLVASDRESPTVACAGRPVPPGSEAADLPVWQGIAALYLTGEGEARARFDIRQGIDRTDAALKRRASAIADALDADQDLRAQLDEVRGLPEPVYPDREWRVLEAQLVVLRLAAAELEVVFGERQRADYPRIAEAALAALGSDDAPTDTALALDAQLRHVLVDEFQDTSEAQVRLLGRLTAGWRSDDGRTLFLVGDPMQSIYRFRHAEVGLYLDVRARGIGDLRLVPLALAVNFRSTRPVVDWVNDCYARVFPSRDDEVSGAVSYAHCVESERAQEAGGVTVHPLFRRSQRREAVLVADLVAARLDEDDSADIAILVQARGHLTGIVAELARRGIRFHATDIDPLDARPAVLDLLALTRAIAHPADRAAWLAVLRAPWCGLRLADLHALCGDAPDATIPDLLGDVERRARLDPDSAARAGRAWNVLEVAADEARRFGLRDAVERAWIGLAGPATLAADRELDEAGAYLEVLADLESRSRGPLEFAALEAALTRLYAPSRPEPGTRVQLLTVHKSKGLEFDTVIVPGLERASGRDARRLLQWARLPALGDDGLLVAPVSGAGEDPGALYRWCEALESRKLSEERRRLLYVAATRARRELHLIGTCRVKEQPGDPPSMIAPSATTALGVLWPVVGPRFAAAFAAAATLDTEPEPERTRVPPLSRLPLGWTPPAIVGPRHVAAPPPPVTGATDVEFDWVTETARHVGTVVHRVLMRLVRGEPAPAADARTRRRLHDELAELGVPADRRGEAVERVILAIDRTLADPRGRWLLDGTHGESASELALTGRVAGNLVSVVVDRTFVDGDGTRWVVDYKTSAHEGSGLEAFLEREELRYRPQLERYADLMSRFGPQPVRRGLYFPLLSAWREWG
ncbi:MAG: UvrD-helicase domain-containing protein [Steroidobacteraceae bacterium]